MLKQHNKYEKNKNKQISESTGCFRCEDLLTLLFGNVYIPVVPSAAGAKILIYVRRFRNFWSKFSNGGTLGATMKWGILGAKSSHWGQMSPMGEILNSGIPTPHPSANVRKIKHWICHQNPNFLKPPSDIQISKSFGETKKCSYFWLRTEPLRS